MPRTPRTDTSNPASAPDDRETRVAAGLADLERWLGDLVRRGLADPTLHDPAFWQAAAARLVDSQMGALARRVRGIAAIPENADDDTWPGRLLAEIGRLWLLVKAAQSPGSCPPALRADVRSLIGWTEKKADLARVEGEYDRWMCAGSVTESLEDRLLERRLWMVSARGRPALIQEFAYGAPVFKTHFAFGACIDAELVFFPAAVPMRAVIKEGARHAPGPLVPSTTHTIRDAIRAYGSVLAENPWLLHFAVSLGDVIPVQGADGGWFVRDAGDADVGLPVSWKDRRTTEHGGWRLMALSGGHPLTVFGELSDRPEGMGFLPLAIWAEGRLIKGMP